MSSPSNLLNSLTYAERKSLAGLVAVALPADDLASGEWNKTLLEDVLTFLDLDTTLAEGFYPMTERGRWEMSLPATGLSAVESWEQRVEAFRACLPPAGEERLVALRDLMVIVALHCGYDARTRVTFRRVCDAMQVPWHPRVSEVESTLARKVYERVSQDRERELKEDRWRGLKIGAAMIGGGALLAVSGGLAAPAVAAGIAASSSLIGATAAATLSGFATTAWMATLFGATGAGLVGYKMDRRTKGVQEFEFESETSAGEEMCVSICVPGLLRDSSDLQRGWGVEPRGPDVTAQERLRRYYYVYNREKVENVDEILKAYKGQEISLCRRLAAKYGADPRDPPTREALAKAEGRELEPLSEEELAIDADAIGCLMETVLSDEKRAKAVSKAADKFSSAVKKRRGGSQADGQEEDDRLMENDHHAPETSNDTSPTSTISWIDHAKVRPKRGASRASAASSRNFLGESPGEVGGRDVDWHGSAPVGFDVVRSRPPGASGKPPDGDYGRASIEGGSTESKRRETTNVSSAVVEGTAIDPNETPVMVGNPGVEGETAMMSTGTGSSPGLETAIAVPWAVVVSSEPPAQGVLLRDWGTSADNSNAKNPPGKVIAKDGSAVDGGASSGALGNVGSRVIGRLRDETLADALNGATMDRPLAWAEAALKRCDGDESRAVALIESTTAKEMDALVEQDAEEERAKGEEEQREMHRVWFWQDMMPHTDQYILRWETKQLLDVGQSVETVVSTLSQSAMEQTLKYTTLATLMAALTWPLALITLANMIDTDWTIGRERADIAGKILADALLNREQGCRPVTLIGTSLGARLIFACLEEITRRHELWEEEVAAGLHAGSEAVGGNPGSQSGSQRRRRRFGRGGRGGGDDGEDGFGADKTKRKPSTRDPKGEARSAAGVIENVAILGAPIGASPARWQRISRIVHGRLINGYSKSDMILGLVFRAKSLSFSIAGVQKVVAPGVENLDLSSIIGTNHFHYNRRMPEVLAALALDDCSRYICRGDDDAVDASEAGPGSGGKDPAGAFESVENFY